MNGTDYAVDVLAAGSVKSLENQVAVLCKTQGSSPISSPRGRDLERRRLSYLNHLGLSNN